MGDNLKSVGILIFMNFIFHLTTIEEYYTGKLVLGVGNLVTDGSVAVVLIYIVMGIFGNSFWVAKVCEDEEYRVVDVFFVIFVFGLMINLFQW